MFNLGFTEILFIAVLALILIGPKQLPEVARTVGRFLNEIKRSTDAITDEFKSAAFKVDDEPPKQGGYISHETEERDPYHDKYPHPEDTVTENTTKDEKKDS